MIKIRNKIYNRLFKAGFVQQVMLLTGGTAIAQILMIIALPFLTRIYTPEDYSVLAIYASILGVVSAISCLRLEIAIPIAESVDDAINLLALSLLFLTILSAGSIITIFLYSDAITDLIRQPKIKPYMWLLPLGMWFTGVYTALRFWATRKKNFRMIAKTRITQAFASIGSQIGFGIVGLTPVGLLIGQLISSSAGITVLARDLLKSETSKIKLINYRSLWNALRKYKQFPKYSMLEALCNNAGIQAPILIIAALALGPEVGYLALSTRVMAAPIQLLGGSIRQVYLSRAPEEFRQGTLAIFTAKVLKGLITTGIGPIIFIGVLAPIIFPLIFGEPWKRAGEIVRWMTPWFILQFLASPLSMALHVTNNQRNALFLQILGLTIRISAVLITFNISATYIVEAYALSGFLFYAIYLSLIIKVCGLSFQQLYSAFRSSFLIVLIWIVASVLILLAVNHTQLNIFP